MTRLPWGHTGRLHRHAERRARSVERSLTTTWPLTLTERSTCTLVSIRLDIKCRARNLRFGLYAVSSGANRVDRHCPPRPFGVADTAPVVPSQVGRALGAARLNCAAVGWTRTSPRLASKTRSHASSSRRGAADATWPGELDAGMAMRVGAARQLAARSSPAHGARWRERRSLVRPSSRAGASLPSDQGNHDRHLRCSAATGACTII